MNDFRGNYQEDQPARGGVTTPFPLKLHDMLLAVSENNLEEIVSWQPHGRCFVVHNPKAFVEEVLPKYMKLSKLASFQRQLNLYGFQRITRGADRGGYYHELFLRNRLFLASSIQRQKVKGTGVRARSNPAQEPNFYDMPFVVGDETSEGSSSCSSSSATPEPSSPLQSFDNSGLPANFFQQQFPLHLEPTLLKENSSNSNSSHDEILFGKHFFDINEEILKKPTALPVAAPTEDMLSGEELDAFFEDFDFPNDIGNEIEDDAVFGSLLEQMIE
ncbi:MAG: hypothetical protein SGARI_003220 [Bacillariaceae sp.]